MYKMNDEISVLIADDNIEFGNLLSNYINQEDGMHVVGVARDGFQTIDMVKSLKPDLVILDIIMPNLDGIGVLEKLPSLNLEHKPIFIMLTAIGQETFIKKAILLGADFYFVKPFDVDILISRIKQLIEEKHSTSISRNELFPNSYSSKLSTNKISAPENSLEIEITNLMRDIGIPPHMTGYQYIREAVLRAANDSKVFSSITKVLYPEVAKKFNITPQKVERSIRNAIESTWTRGNHDLIDSLFGYTITYRRGKPTNSEFIAMMADKIRLYKKNN